MKPFTLLRYALIVTLTVASLGGIIYLCLLPPTATEGKRCQQVSIRVSSELGGEALFLSPEQVEQKLSNQGLTLRGKEFSSIDLRQLEQALLKMPIYKEAEAYFSPASSTLRIELVEKAPRFLVYEPSGKSYYVTQGRDTFAVSSAFAAYLPVVSGDVTTSLATGPVYDLLETVRQDPYFTDYFGQVYVDQEQGLSLIPRLGTTRVIFGHNPDWAAKLRKWRIFAESVLPRRGMNAFDYVNLDYADQIIARERYPAEGEEFPEPASTPTPAPTSKAPSKPTSPAPAKEKPAKPAPKPAVKAPAKESPKGRAASPSTPASSSTKAKPSSPKPTAKPQPKQVPPSQKKKK